MTELSTKRSPLLPTMPTPEEMSDAQVISQWRLGNLILLKDLHRSIVRDLEAIDTAIATDIATHAALTTGTHGVGAGTIAKVSDIAATKLDDFTAPDDTVDLDASTSKHGLFPKFPNSGTDFLRDDKTWKKVLPGGDQVVAYGATPTVTFTSGAVAGITMTGNITTLTIAGMSNGDRCVLFLTQDGTGSRLVSAWSGVDVWLCGGAAPVLTTTAAAVDAITFVKHNDKVYGALTPA